MFHSTIHNEKDGLSRMLLAGRFYLAYSFSLTQMHAWAALPEYLSVFLRRDSVRSFTFTDEYRAAAGHVIDSKVSKKWRDRNDSFLSTQTHSNAGSINAVRLSAYTSKSKCLSPAHPTGISSSVSILLANSYNLSSGPTDAQNNYVSMRSTEREQHDILQVFFFLLHLKKYIFLSGKVQCQVNRSPIFHMNPFLLF